MTTESPRQNIDLLFVASPGNTGCLDVVRELERDRFDPKPYFVRPGDELEQALLGSNWDIIFCDDSLAEWRGPETLSAIQRLRPDIPVVVICSEATEADAAHCMRVGARDYVVRERSLHRVRSVVDRELRENDQRRRATETNANLQGQLLQAQKMEALGQLAGGIAHDFNNIITVILTFAGFIRDDLSQGDPRHGDIVEVLKAADRASALTRQLLAFSRRQSIEPRLLDINTLVRNIEKMLYRTLGEDIQLVTDLQDELWSAYIDPGQFEQVLLNLAVNARDAMPRGGALTISTRNSQDLQRPAPGTSVAADYVVLSVADTGVGIDPEICERIFEPFFTTKDKGKGTGLGLATCYGIVQQAEGHMVVESIPNQGTAFRVYLPRRGGKPTSLLPTIRAEAEYAGSERILVVEDDPSILRLAARILRQQGYTVLEARSGDEALALAQSQEQPLDLLLSDVIMPKMSGRELAQHLRKLFPNLKVLFMTGHAAQATEAHGFTEDLEHVLPKPFSARAMSRKVRLVLDQSAEADLLAIELERG